LNDEIHDHDLGLVHDLPTLVDRRRALRMFAGAGLGLGLATIAGCSTSGTDSAATATTAAGGGSPSTTAAATTSSTAANSAAAAVPELAECASLPTETTGPYPGDGSNGPDVLSESGVVRRDITTSFAGLTGTAGGVPLAIKLKVLDVANGCVPLPGAAVYAWHCSREAGYSLYSAGVKDQNFLRGVQAADDDGWVTFDSIFPAAYDGRWPHVHFEIYRDLASASQVTNKVLTSQLALPQDACEAVYATSGYEASVANLARTSLARDMVFRDGWQTQLATVTGDVGTGLTALLNAPVTANGSASRA
jgi:protocatechuate 3,4-dioxygenase beta subunit